MHCTKSAVRSRLRTNFFPGGFGEWSPDCIAKQKRDLLNSKATLSDMVTDQNILEAQGCISSLLVFFSSASIFGH